ncbi:HAD family hydrolase [Sphingobacterium thalpophilum]|uniref:HAD hydrolase n=2 Tax=Sphingobacterium thalpophilum TaxID=259 RepID=A0A4U9UHD8_9SPHI|nr:HAD family hydrolase [Sphingobacterium thalpophilum]VTR28924.1 HAD hydrolase [Sphingobacterium thalpophilum]
MIETASRISEHTISIPIVNQIIAIGHDLLQKPIELLPGVTETLEQLKDHYRLVVATKGDLLDQERKLKKSGLEDYFHHIEIMSDKNEKDYYKLLKHLDCPPDQFMMLGNSLRSDILPVLQIGGFGVHIPYHITWAHEQHELNIKNERFIALRRVDEVLPYLK